MLHSAIILYKLLLFSCHVNYSVTYIGTQYKNIKLHIQNTKLTTTNIIIRFYSGNLFYISEFEKYTE